MVETQIQGEDNSLLESQAVRLETRDSKKSQVGKVELKTYPQSVRAGRALKFGGITFVFCLVSILIPVAHFVLVPILAIATPIVAWKTYQQERTVLGGNGPCPDCGKELTINASSDSWPLMEACTHCGARMDIYLEKESL